MIGVWKRSSQVSAPCAASCSSDASPTRSSSIAAREVSRCARSRSTSSASLRSSSRFSREPLLAENGVALAGDALLERRLQLFLGARDRARELALALDQPLLFAQPLGAPALDLGVLTVEARGLLQVRFEPLAEDVEAAAAPGAGGRHQLAALARGGEGRLRLVEAALEPAVAVQPLGQLAAQPLAP